MINEKRIVDEFMELVQVDSESKFERQICDLLTKKFKAFGLDVMEDDAAEKTGHEAGNLIVTMNATNGYEDKDMIYFTSHMDTVVPGRGIKPQIDDDGYIRSDGTTILGSDDKAGIASILEAIKVLQENNIPHGPLQFIITIGEEGGLFGAKALDPSHVKAKYGYALDSNEIVGNVACAAPSQSKIDVTVLGKSAHAGVNPEKGISAVVVASKAIANMPLGRIDHETTANIGVIEGGKETNIVVDEVNIRAEARSIDSEKLDKQVAAMKEAFEKAAEEAGTKVNFNSEIIYPSFLHDETSELVQVAEKAIQKVGREMHLFHSGGASDANIFNGMGVPTVNLALGYEKIHTTEEQMPIKELLKSAELVVAIIEEVAK
ncbi:M20/M25/M40 family metallo-hydrolase [Longirhabdus pacifica]|uniref:M20/M25/M40 family metallo-hydrolase n=1 Tax=Longirhabdus pacifica TaxID=2305227 RepID=UPI001008DDF3|nr:M20/M25/M40 family metallo-hydrolase [Longirhabdus pacifica]